MAKTTTRTNTNTTLVGSSLQSNEIGQMEEVELGIPKPHIPHPIRDVVGSLPKLARKMGLVPEMAILRSFACLNVKMLLYRQAELTSLEEELLDLEDKDSKSSEGLRSRYSRNSVLMARDAQSAQAKLVAKIQAKLKEYNDALNLQATLSQLPEPRAIDLDHIQRFLSSPEIIDQPITGPDKHIWGSTVHPYSHYPDLVVLRGRQKTDFFSEWIRGPVIKAFFRYHGHRWRKPSPVNGLIAYSDESILKITLWVTGILASSLPVLSIIILYLIKSMPLRLAIITIFNITLSICLLGFTVAKPSDIFAITSAFAAVQVVFVGTDNLNSRS